MWDPESGRVSSWSRLRPSCWLNIITAGGLLQIPEGGAGDIALVSLLSCLLLAASFTRGQKIIRAEAVGLLLLYLSYVSARTLLSTAAASS